MEEDNKIMERIMILQTRTETRAKIMDELWNYYDIIKVRNGISDEFKKGYLTAIETILDMEN